MSPRAAWRLEHLGFEAYDYVGGKVDWLAAGLPTVRADPSERRAIDVAEPVPETCGPDDPVEAVDEAVLVVNEHGILLGRVRAGTSTAGARAVDVMEPGPATVRAHEPLDPLLERMARRDVREIVVTTPEGRPLGVVRRTA